MNDFFYIISYITGYNILKHYKLYKDFNNKEITISNPKEFKSGLTTKETKRIKSFT